MRAYVALVTGQVILPVKPAPWLRLPTAVARVRAQIRLCVIFGGQCGSGAGFLRVLRFPLSILIPPTAPHSSSIIRAGTIGQLAADVPSGLSLTPLQETKKNLALHCIREILGSSTGWNTCYAECCYSWLSFASAGKSKDSASIRLTKLPCRSLPIHQTYYNLTLYPGPVPSPLLMGKRIYRAAG
jgi:hypothetical protein